MAIALTEFLDTQPVKPAIQLFATDVSDESIEKARMAVYPESISAEVSPERLDRFFSRCPDGYQVKKSLREAIVFAKHDVTRDPPFSRLDLISCRNLLIYLGQVLQRRLIPVFHYALRPGGFLLLGSSESVGEYTNLFTLVDQKHKLYAKAPVAARPPLDFGFRQYPVAPEAPAQRQPRPRKSIESTHKKADRIAMERYVPPGVLVDENMQILQFRGDTSPFLRHMPDRATLDLIEMAREGLGTSLRAHIVEAAAQHAPVRAEGVNVRRNGDFRRIDLEIVPIAAEDGLNYLVFFEEPSRVPEPEKKPPGKKRPRADAEVEDLRHELEQTRQQLRLTVDEKDASMEAQRAANEEIQSGNEELQSINEELETAKEELQSTNEELTTLNEELQNRNFELLGVNDDLRNVLSSVQIPILILWKDLRIRRYTPMAEKALSIIPTDVGRPLTDLKLKLDIPDLAGLIHDVLEDLGVKEQEVRDENGHWYRLHVRPYRTADDRIEGAVLALLDIDELKRTQERLTATLAEVEDSQQYNKAVLDTMHELFVVLHVDARVARASRAFVRAFGLSGAEFENISLFDVGDGRLDSPGLRELIDRTLKGGEVQEAEVTVEIPNRGQVLWRLNVRRVNRKGGEPLVMLAATEIP